MKEKQVSLFNKTRVKMVAKNRQNNAQRGSGSGSECGNHDLCHRLTSKSITDPFNSIENRKSESTSFVQFNSKQSISATNPKTVASKRSKPEQCYYNNNKYFQPIVSTSPKENSPLPAAVVSAQLKKMKPKTSQPKSNSSPKNSPSWNRDCTLSPIFSYYAGAKFSNPPSPTEVPKPPVRWLQPSFGACTCPCSNPCAACPQVLRNNHSNTLLHVPA